MKDEGRVNRRATKGFTLIELLVVIAIIAVLLAIIMPAMRKIKESAKQTICRSNLRNVGFAVMMYLDDSDRKLPNYRSANGFLWYDAGGNLLTLTDSSAYWGIVFKPYLKETKIFGCPSLRRVPSLIYNVDPDAVQEAAFALNFHEDARNKSTNDLRPSEFIFCHDHMEPRVENNERDMFHNNDTLGAMNLTHYRQGGSRSEQYRDIFRHSIRANEPFKTGGRANILWLDGHVTTLEETTGDDVRMRWYTGAKKTVISFSLRPRCFSRGFFYSRPVAETYDQAAKIITGNKPIGINYCVRSIPDILRFLTCPSWQYSA